MIVASLDIENYKQYAGSHRIEFPEHGIVAVTGPNGAGKTTLFEAIEWCLYCPRAIPQGTVPPHDGVGRTVVCVTLEDPTDGKRYCVQRELRASGTQAEVFLEADPGQPLVQGTREVTRYVAKNLIGLPHAAFVSTFFTKQKELQFFADRTATERRTEVGRLLGLEAVREAQHEMGEGRAAARSLAEARRAEYERRLGERDLAAEADAAASLVAEAEEREAEAEQAAQGAATAAEEAREVLDRLRDLQAQDAAIGQQLAELAGAAATATARRDGATAQLQRLDARAEERKRLEPLAAAVDRLCGEVERLEREQERARLHAAYRETRLAAEEREREISHGLEQLVADHGEAAQGPEGWIWTPEDASDIAGAAGRLHATALSLDPSALRRQLDGVQRARQLANDIEKIESTLGKYYRQRDKLACERDEHLAGGDPVAAVEAAAETVHAARNEEQTARMAIAASRVERQEDEKLLAGLRQHLQDPVCPTCSRPLGADEAARLVAILEKKIRGLGEQERSSEALAREITRRVVTAEEVEAVTRRRLEAVRSLETRLADGERMIEDAEAQRDESALALGAVLEAIGGTGVPTPDEIAAMRQRAEQTQRIAGLAGLLERFGDEAMSVRQVQAEAAARIDALGEVAYDPAGMKAAVDRLSEARRAAAQVELIDVELASRGQVEAAHTEEEQELARLARFQAVTVAERAALAFDSELLRAAVHQEQEARGAAHEARERYAAARTVVRDAQTERNRVIADHEQLRELIAEADRNAREADELTRMYDEFAEFDRYVARHVGPLLAETTERMLGQVTEGKYDHVQFDEHYGIEVYDGDEAFPLAGFSGGERDVVALCARLALSEVVGSAALRPPRFLVLDEVFGSLDSERRAQLLETLGSLANSGHFQQMFIISHVDDVQQSPVMNEAWTIEERDGVSRVVRQGAVELALAASG